MSGRRRHERFEIADPWSGSLRLLREVDLSVAGDRRLAVISPTPVATGEVMQIEVVGAAATATLHGQVAGSHPVPHDGTVLHAMDVDLLDDPDGSDRAGSVHEEGSPRPDGLAEMLTAADLVGVLTRDVPVQMRNVSGSGCLLASGSSIEAGTLGRLRLHIAEREYGDDVRVIRCRRVEGAGSTHQIGVEFAWTTPPGPASLRRIARSFAGESAQTGRS
jgi:hypothetical protein